jgi:hypothetical protein
MVGALAVVDPTAATLLILVPRAGLVATMAIIVSDVTVNFIAFADDTPFAASNWLWPARWRSKPS